MCAIAGGVPNLLHESTRLYDFPGYTHAVSVQRKAAKSCVPGRCRCHLRCTGSLNVSFLFACQSVSLWSASGAADVSSAGSICMLIKMHLCHANADYAQGLECQGSVC